MKEHPILYSTPMVIAKLEGRKTMTRRVIKESFNGCLTMGGPHPCPNEPLVFYPGEQFLDPTDPSDNRKITIDYPQVRADFFCSTLNSTAKCPFGKPGDWLWVRETFTTIIGHHGESLIPIYKADNADPGYGPWKPSIFMPKEYARIWEEVVCIKVERLQDITEKDAIAEGIESQWTDLTTMTCSYKNYLTNNFPLGYTPIDSYYTLWESINGYESLMSNPWVWVVETKILSTNGRP